MDTPRNTAATPVTGRQRREPADPSPEAVPPADRPDVEASRPSEVSHPHADDADHLRAFTPPVSAAPDEHAASGSRTPARRAAEGGTGLTPPAGTPHDDHGNEP